MEPLRRDVLDIENRFNRDLLDKFVTMVDRGGDPDLLSKSAHWQQVWYKPEVVVDTSLDPSSEAYATQQIDPYKEISGRDLDQSVNENTTFGGFGPQHHQLEPVWRAGSHATGTALCASFEAPAFRRPAR
jgi:hypothetical protein